MAEKRVIKIDLGIARTDESGRETRAVLELETSKSYRGGVASDAQVGWVGDHFRTVSMGLGGGGDYSRTLARIPGTAIQSRIDKLHAETFTTECIARITEDARTYSQAIVDRELEQRDKRYATKQDVIDAALRNNPNLQVCQ